MRLHPLAALAALTLLVAPPPAPDVEPYAAPADAGYSAAQLADAYDVAPLHAAGRMGAGVRVAIVTWGPADDAAFGAYADAMGLPRTSLTHHGECSPDAALDEWNLDAQMVKAMAPLAEVHVYCARAAQFAALDAALDAAIADGMEIVSLSWGACESRVPRATADLFHDSFANASARGAAVFAASGDGGSRECTRWSVGDQDLRTSWPATDPLAVAVGGTRLAPAWSESVWNTCAPCPDADWRASGGGVSILHAAPYWQDAGARESPDVAAVADRALGVAVFSNGRWLAMGGTSVAAPLWAGVWALAVEENGRMGPPGPLLYAAPKKAWNDVKDGTNGDYAAGPGRDLATGLGSPRGASLIPFLDKLPPAPAGLAAVRGPARGEVGLSWDAAPGASGYVVLRGARAGDERPVAQTQATTFVDAGLPDGSAWSYRVAVAGGPASLPVEGRALALPGAPRDLGALPTTDQRVALAWTAPADDGGTPALRYRVWRAVDGVETLAGATTERALVDDGCPRLALCVYSVDAENVVGAGTRSEAAVAVGLR